MQWNKFVHQACLSQINKHSHNIFKFQAHVHFSNIVRSHVHLDTWFKFGFTIKSQDSIESRDSSHDIHTYCTSFWVSDAYAAQSVFGPFLWLVSDDLCVLVKNDSERCWGVSSSSSSCCCCGDECFFL